MRLATFNIYWLGNDKFVEMSGLPGRTGADWSRIARVIARLDADVVAFQEIIDVAELQEVLGIAGGLTARRYRLFDAANHLLGEAKYGGQKVVVTYDETRYELADAAPVSGGGKGLAYGIRLKGIDGGGQVTVVGVHLKSGQPTFTNAASADKRKGQCEHLRDWVAGLVPVDKAVFAAPGPGEHAVILGDFNALYRSDDPCHAGVVASLDPLREEKLADWWWDEPAADPLGGGRTTAYLEDLLIDYVMLSPSLKERILQPPAIYAFDRDPDIGATGLRVSDHRPVLVEIDISAP